eukprot:SAG31_NODE_16784_length_696_cov_0.869347_1_plen_221_part_10
MASAGSKLLPVSATPGWLRPVRYLDPSTSRVPAFTIAEAAQGVKSRLSGDTGSVVGGGARQFCLDMPAGSWSHTRQIDFGAGGHTAITLRLKATSTAVFSMHLNSLSSPSVSSCTVAKSSEWQTIRCPLQPLHGVHDIWFSVVATAAQQTLSPEPAEDFSTKGCQVSGSICYADNRSTRTLSGANPGGAAPPLGTAGPLTPEFCSWQCHLLNFSLAGTEYS